MMFCICRILSMNQGQRSCWEQDSDILDLVSDVAHLGGAKSFTVNQITTSNGNVLEDDKSVR